MNCYVCSVEALDRSCAAIAICQQCGAGICQDHLYTLPGAASVGMAGNRSRQLICCACNDLLIVRPRKASASRAGQNNSRQQWWNRWRNRKESTLPEPQEAVMAVEHFLQTKRH